MSFSPPPLFFLSFKSGIVLSNFSFLGDLGVSELKNVYRYVDSTHSFHDSPTFLPRFPQSAAFTCVYTCTRPTTTNIPLCDTTTITAQHCMARLCVVSHCCCVRASQYTITSLLSALPCYTERLFLNYIFFCIESQLSPR